VTLLEQFQRIDRAQHEEYEWTTAPDGSTWCSSPSGKTYRVSEQGCTCADWQYRGQGGAQCKHIVALADKLFAERMAEIKAEQGLKEAKERITDRFPEGDEGPKAEWVRGVCPECNGPVVCNSYYVGGKGYVTRMECWGSLGSHRDPTCDYRRVL
jgi:hypothetical protein